VEFREQSDDFVHRETQVGGCRNMDLPCLQWRRDEQEGEGDETGESHGCAFYTTRGTKGKARVRGSAGFQRLHRAVSVYKFVPLAACGDESSWPSSIMQRSLGSHRGQNPD
jgi:hypothetical protein